MTARFVGRQLALAVLGRRFRHGYACVNFGTPLSMRAYVAEHGVDFRTLDDAGRRAPVAAVGATLMARIGRIVPVLPVPLVASVLLRDPARAMSELELKAEVQELMRRVEAAGAHVYVPRGDRDYAITVGLRMLTLRELRARARRGTLRREPGRAGAAALLRELDRPPRRNSSTLGAKRKRGHRPRLEFSEAPSTSYSLLPAKPRSESSAWKTL